MPVQSMKRKLGYLLLAYSFIGWGAVFVVPFLGYSLGNAAGIITGLIVSSEIAFLLGILLIGRESWERFKLWLKQAMADAKTKDSSH